MHHADNMTLSKCQLQTLQHHTKTTLMFILLFDIFAVLFALFMETEASKISLILDFSV